jgi:hypothetical protein
MIMDANRPSRSKEGYLFTAEILVEGYNNGIALETLLGILNSEKIKDYQIKKGVSIGKIIDATVQENKKKEPVKMPPVKKASVDMAAQLENYKANNTLLRLTIAQAKGEKMSIPCRILNFDTSSEYVTVYHVDEKKVYQFNLYEIEELNGS